MAKADEKWLTAASRTGFFTRFVRCLGYGSIRNGDRTIGIRFIDKESHNSTWFRVEMSVEEATELRNQLTNLIQMGGNT